MEISNKLIVFLAILVGLVYIIPHLVYLVENDHYNPLSLTANFGALDESIYAAGVSEVLGGYLFPSDLTVFEHKNGPNFYGPLPFFIMGIFALLVGGIKNALIFSDFVFSALSFILFFYLFNIFLNNIRLSIISSLFFVFFYRLFIPIFTLSPSNILENIYKIFISRGGSVNFWFSRFVQPQISMIFFLLTLILLYWALKKNKLSYYLLTGFLFSLNFIAYNFVR